MKLFPYIGAIFSLSLISLALILWVRGMLQEWVAHRNERRGLRHSRLAEIRDRLRELHEALELSEDQFTRRGIFAEVQELLEERRGLLHS